MMRVDNMCHTVLTLLVVTLFACAAAAAAAPASDDKRQVDARVVTSTPVRFCHFQTPCAWRIYTYLDLAEISLTNKYCECRPTQKCKFYERHISEGYSEFRCMSG